MFFLFPLLYYNYSFIYLYNGYASYIHISRGYVKHKRLRTTALEDQGPTEALTNIKIAIFKENYPEDMPQRLGPKSSAPTPPMALDRNKNLTPSRNEPIISEVIFGIDVSVTEIAPKQFLYKLQQGARHLF
jgi:hypothetical protein